MISLIFLPRIRTSNRGLENALLEVPQLRSISFTDCAKPCPELAMAMAGVLKGGEHGSNGTRNG